MRVIHNSIISERHSKTRKKNVVLLKIMEITKVSLLQFMSLAV